MFYAVGLLASYPTGFSFSYTSGFSQGLHIILPKLFINNTMLGWRVHSVILIFVCHLIQKILYKALKEMILNMNNNELETKWI